MHEFELRHYDASIGRFVTTDPYEQFENPYLAMGNNPVVSYDPDGGYCKDANGNVIACPDGYIFNEYSDSEDNHTTIFDDVEIGGSSTSTSSEKDPNLWNGDKRKYYDEIDWSKVYKKETDALVKSMHQATGKAAEIIFEAALTFAPIPGLSAATGIAIRGFSKLAPVVKVTSTALRVVAPQGIKISVHALQRLAQRGVTKKMVLKTIEKGEKFLDKRNGVITYILRNGTAKGHSLKVSVSIHNEGVVTTVIKSSKSYNALTKGLQKIN